jgi:hypothetical protein
LGPKGRSSEAEELGIGGYEYTEGRKDDPLKCHKWALESLENKTPPPKKRAGNQDTCTSGICFDSHTRR